MRLRSMLIVGLFLLSVTPAHALFQEITELQRRLQQVQQLSPLESLTQELGQTVFSDVDQRAWYAPYIASMVRRNIVSGDTDAQGRPRGTFRPNDFVTVAEALKIVFRAAGVDEQGCTAQTWNAYATSHWARLFVACAEGLGVRMLGRDTTLNRVISRAEVLSLLDDVFGDVTPALVPPFRDAVGHRYSADIAYNARLRVITGDVDERGSPTGTFRPDDPIRRSEMVKIIARKLQTRGM